MDKSQIIEKSWDELFSLTTKDKPLSDMMNPSKFLVLSERYKGLSFSALDVKAKSFAQVDWKLLKKGKPVEKETDALYSLLKQPNPLFTDFEFRYIYAIYKYALGEVYIYVARDKLGVPRSLWILPTPFMQPVWETDPKKRAKGNLISHYELTATSVDGTDIKTKFMPNEIIFVRTPNPINLYRGIGELESNLLETDIHTFSKKYVRDFYKNGAVPQGVLKTQQKLTPEEVERLRKQWNDKYSGLRSGWKIAILPNGLEYDKISTDPTTTNFIEQAKWTRDDILAVFKVPLAKLGYVEGVNRAVAREQNQAFYKDVIAPEIRRYAEMINTQLLSSPDILTQYKVEFYNILPQDQELQVEKGRVGATFGAITLNELREFLGLKPIPDGDELITPLNAGKESGRPTGTTKPTSDNQQDGSGGEVTNEDNKAFEDIFKQVDSYIGEIING